MLTKKLSGNKRIKCSSSLPFLTLTIPVLVSFITCDLYGQSNSNSSGLPGGILPMPAIIYYTNIPAFYNPAASFSRDKFYFNSKVASYTGVRKDIKEYYFDTWFQFKKETGFAVGLQLYDNQQGAFIHLLDAKLDLKYTWSLTSKTQVSTALAAGFLNYAFKGNDYIAGGSDIAPDLDFGVNVKSEKWSIGMAFKHLIKQSLYPIVAEFRKNEVINIHAHRRLHLSPDFILKPTVLANINLPYHRQYLDITLEGEYKKYFQIITLLYHYNNLGIGAGIQNLPSPVGEFGLNFVFSRSFSQLSSVASNRYEIGFSYKISKSETSVP